MDPAKERQAQLEEKYHFTCKCVKCVEEINVSLYFTVSFFVELFSNVANDPAN